MTSNAGNKKNVERVEDLHLQLSEKYQTYKDLADRCLINAQHIGNSKSISEFKCR